jgi:hypothetical protein
MFPPQWHLIQQESSLISSCLFTGLTDLRNANIHDKGLFYTAFYNLAIGLERLLKLTLIIDYMHCNNLQCPTSKYVRAYGHDLIKLSQACQQRADAIDLPCDLKFSSSIRKQELVAFLNDYSNGLRYHNLDTLQGNASGRDPLASWNDIINSIYMDEVSGRKKINIESKAQILANSIREYSIILHHGLDQSELDVDTFTLQPAQINASAPYAIVHVIEIVNEINKLHFKVADMISLECSKQGKPDYVPYVQEGYSVFNNSRRYLLDKKKWP